MKKFLLPGILAVVFLFLPSRSQAVPVDMPYQILVSTVNTAGVVVLSTANFPSPNATVNSLVANYQWCVEQANVSCPSAANFTIYWATSTLSSGTTDYTIVTSSGVPFDTNFQYRTPYCAPVGKTVVTLQSSVATSTITARGYLFKGWN